MMMFAEKTELFVLVGSQLGTPVAFLLIFSSISDATTYNSSAMVAIPIQTKLTTSQEKKSSCCCQKNHILWQASTESPFYAHANKCLKACSTRCRTDSFIKQASKFLNWKQTTLGAWRFHVWRKEKAIMCFY